MEHKMVNQDMEHKQQMLIFIPIMALYRQDPVILCLSQPTSVHLENKLFYLLRLNI